MRPPVSVIVTPGAGAPTALLESLRPSLGPQDEVLVVGEGRSSGAVRYLGRRTSLAEQRAVALQAALHDLCLVLDGDVLPPAHALDPLVALMGASDVSVVVPCTDLAAGAQQVVASYASMASPSALRSFARSFRDAQRDGETVDEPADTVFLASRRALLAQPDPGPGLAARLAAEGRGALVRAWWHHRDGRACGLRPERRPLLSASMIVKDEEEALPRSLAPLLELCDEVVVYDTGSSDRTVEIARSAGATVVEGYWNDSFGDARNRSLVHSTGDWVLIVDADEVVDGDREELLRTLRTTSSPCLALNVTNLSASGNGTPLRALQRRVARREVSWWKGRLHEQLAHRDGNDLAAVAYAGLGLVHSGYLAARMAERDKGRRNLALAELAVADAALGSDEEVAALAHLARSQHLAGDREAALETAGRLGAGGRPVYRRQLLQMGCEVARALGRLEDSRGWLERLRAEAAGTGMLGREEALTALQERRYEDALLAVGSVPEYLVHDSGEVSQRSSLIAIEVQALRALGRSVTAAERIVELAAAGSVDLALESVVRVHTEAGVPLAGYFRALPEDALLTVLAEARTLPLEAADACWEAAWEADRRRTAVLAASMPRVHELAPERALVWSRRLARVGAPECPLLTLAAQDGRTARDRVIAAALALEELELEAAIALFLSAAADVPPEQEDEVVRDLHRLAPRAAQVLLA